jgi:hypothetical protein
MGQRKVTILPKVSDNIASIVYYIDAQGMSLTARKFYDELNLFFETLGNDFIERRDCPYKNWKELGYKCIGYKKKYVIAFLSYEA